MKTKIVFLTTAFIALSFLSCSSAGKNETAEPAAIKPRSTSVKFNADTAMRYLARQVEFGPRVPDTPAHKECADWLTNQLRAMGARVTSETERISHPVDGKPINVRNIFASFNPDASKRILVLAHYDTRPWADEDADPSNRNKPIDGANDGASGVAVALELARLNSHLKSDQGLDILFVDQEDSGNSGTDESWCIGSAHWSRNLPYTPQQMPEFAILLDMVGGRDAVFMREYFSEAAAPSINAKIWETAQKLNYGNRFPDVIGGAVNDDHIWLLKAGIPAVDIIEMNTDPSSKGFNSTWHTLDDNLGNIDKTTLQMVGDVITSVIYD